MKMFYATIAMMAFLGALAAPVSAGEMRGMAGMKGGDNKAQAGQRHMGQGTVNKVDAKAGKVTLAHGPIQSLAWPAMTMDFPVKDNSLLNNLKPGMKVEFELEKGSGNEYVIANIKSAKP